MMCFVGVGGGFWGECFGFYMFTALPQYITTFGCALAGARYLFVARQKRNPKNSPNMAGYTGGGLKRFVYVGVS